MMMKISVVTVCYNAVKSIEETMLSVLNQTYDNIEYIIIDGGSTDGTVDIIKKYSDRLAYWVSEPDKGIYDAMNKGIIAATGDYINFMNAGDSFYSNKTLADIEQHLDNSTVVIYGDCYMKFGDIGFIRKPLKLKYLKTKPPFCHQSTFIKLKYQSQNLYDANLKIASDYKFFYDAYYRDSVTFRYIPHIIACFDSRSGVSTNEYKRSLQEKFTIWGIEDSFIKKFPHYIKLMRTHISHFIKHHISPIYVVKIKQFLDSTRRHI